MEFQASCPSTTKSYMRGCLQTSGRHQPGSFLIAMHREVLEPPVKVSNGYGGLPTQAEVSALGHGCEALGESGRETTACVSSDTRDPRTFLPVIIWKRKEQGQSWGVLGGHVRDCLGNTLDASPVPVGSETGQGVSHLEFWCQLAWLCTLSPYVVVMRTQVHSC